MKEMFDIVIPIAKNDIGALKHTLPYIIKQFPNHRVKVIANGGLRTYFDAYDCISFIDEDEMLCGISYDSVKKCIEARYPKASRRTGWYFQQFLKLGYSLVCDKEYYLTWDSDTLPLKGLQFFDENEKPYLDYLPYVIDDAAYGETINELWKNRSILPNRDFSFITEHMLFKTNIVRELISEIENNTSLAGKNFGEKIINAVSLDNLNLSGFSEFETYSSFVRCRYPDVYVLRRWKNLRNGKSFFGEKPSERQLEWASECFDVISIEDFDHQLLVSKVLCNEKRVGRYSFKKVYELIYPLIKFQYYFRMRIRRVIRK